MDRQGEPMTTNYQRAYVTMSESDPEESTK